LLVKILLLGLWACFPLSLFLSLSLYSRTYLSHTSLQYTGAVLMEFLSRLYLSSNHVTSCQIASCMSQLATSWGTLRRMCLSCVSGGTPKSIAAVVTLSSFHCNLHIRDHTIIIGKIKLTSLFFRFI